MGKLDPVVMAVDVGTSGCKITVVDRAGNVRRSGSTPYAHTTHSDPNGIVEQKPDDWLNAFVEAAAGVLQDLEEQIAAVVLSGMMQCLVLVNEAGVALRDSMQYNDSRAKEEAAELEARAGGAEQLARRLRNWKGPVSFPAKIKWLATHEPHVLEQTATLLLGSHDYIALKLCGICVADAVTASTTGLLGQDGEYSFDVLCELLSDLKIDIKTILPKIIGGQQIVGHVQTDAATTLGLRLQGVPVIHGSGDLGTTTRHRSRNLRCTLCIHRHIRLDCRDTSTASSWNNERPPWNVCVRASN